MSYLNPLREGGPILVTQVGTAEGARAAAAALACEGAEADATALLVDLGGRPPRPTLLSSAAAQELEKRIGAHLPAARAAARGRLCQLAVAAEPEGYEVASAAITVARGAPAVVHLPPALLQPAAEGMLGCRPSAVLLRADLGVDRALVALVARDLLARGCTVGVLKSRLGWVSERRALFGVLPAGSDAGVPPRLVRRLLASRGREELPAAGPVPGLEAVS
jgi:hypothetical protein